MRTLLENTFFLDRKINNILIASFIEFINKSMEELRMKTKTIIVGASLAGLAALFQLIPVITSEAFVLLTVFSALPIYIIARIDAKAGSLAYLVAASIVTLFSLHEGLFFLCTNGVVGLSLGISNHYLRNKTTIYVIASFILAAALIIMNFIIGIPVFGVKLPISPFAQLIIMLAFSLVYSAIYYNFANFIFKILSRYWDFNSIK